MALTKYKDADGIIHTVSTERLSFGGYAIYLDGKYYAQADDRIELDDAVRELVAYKKFTVVHKKAKRNTPRKPASTHAE